MDTNINFTNDLNGESDCRISFNLPCKIYNLTAGRAVADGAIVVESESCTYETMLNIDRARLLNEASLLLLPNTYKEGKLYSHKPLNGNGDFTATRATTATRVNAAGLVELVPYNLVSWSEMFSNAAWSKFAVSITANTTTAPDGTLTADSLIEDNANSAHFTSINTTSAFGTYTASIYAKPNGRNWMYFNLYAAANSGAWFDVQNGVVGLIQSNITSATITAVGNGWYRCTITGANVSVSPRVAAYTSSDNNVSSYAGNGTSGLFIWGAQLVEGTSARDYLRTETRLNIPRIDYSLGGCPNILLEPQRTNLALQSSSFDSATWTKANSSVTANSTTSPSGIVDADTLTADGTTSLHIAQQSISVVNATSYTISVYAKKNTNNFLQIVGGTSGFGVNVWANFDLNNGVVGSVGISTTARIENAGNGWYRCIIIGTSTATTSAPILLNIVTSATSLRGETNSLSTSVFLWGAQLEAGAYATSHIPTTTASVTRNFDYINRNNLVTNGIVSATQGTWFLEIRNNLPFIRDTSVSSLNFGMDGNNCLRFRSSGSGRISAEKNVGGVLTVLAGGAITTETMKIAFKWNGSEVETFMNGVQQTPANKTYPSTIVPQTLTTNFTNTNFGVPMTINEMAFFPTQLTDSQLITLTTL